MKKTYRKKPVVIEAIQYTGDNVFEIKKFCVRGALYVGGKYKNGELYILTLEGKMRVSKGDYIIKGVKGEVYPCKPDIFEQTYEEVPPNLNERFENYEGETKQGEYFND